MLVSKRKNTKKNVISVFSLCGSLWFSVVLCEKLHGEPQRTTENIAHFGNKKASFLYFSQFSLYLTPNRTKMIDRQLISKPVASEFQQFETDFARSLQSDIPLLQSVLQQVFHTNGKHIRPLLLLLTAKICGEPTHVTQLAAVIIETLHTTTLIHDDVVDETKQRRGIPSLNAVFDNRIAVLTGDFILSSSIIHAVEIGNMAIIKTIARVCRELSEGELLQIDHTEKRIIDEEKYLLMIRKKTATLLSACSEIGALSVNAPSETVEKCRLFGEYLGYCFQIKDDIFDYFTEVNIGKPTGNDLREGKITLPLIQALKNAPDNERLKILNIIDNQDYTLENVSFLIQFAKRYQGIEYAEKRLIEYKEEAVKIINSFPESAARTSLLLLADYFTQRTN